MFVTPVAARRASIVISTLVAATVVAATAVAATAVAGTRAQTPAPSTTPLPDGEGKAVLQTMCVTCHGTDTIVAQRRTRELWQHVVADMTARGAPGTPADQAAAIGYLARFFGKVEVNKAPADELRTVLTLTAPQADAIVRYRQRHGDYKTLDDLKKVPLLAAKQIDAAKDRITF